MLIKSQVIAAPGQEGEKKHNDIEKLICEALNGVTITDDEELVIPHPQRLIQIFLNNYYYYYYF